MGTGVPMSTGARPLNSGPTTSCTAEPTRSVSTSTAPGTAAATVRAGSSAAGPYRTTVRCTVAGSTPRAPIRNPAAARPSATSPVRPAPEPSSTSTVTPAGATETVVPSGTGSPAAGSVRAGSVGAASATSATAGAGSRPASMTESNSCRVAVASTTTTAWSLPVGTWPTSATGSPVRSIASPVSSPRVAPKERRSPSVVPASTVTASPARERKRVRVSGSASVLPAEAESSAETSTRCSRSAAAAPVTSAPVAAGCR